MMHGNNGDFFDDFFKNAERFFTGSPFAHNVRLPVHDAGDHYLIYVEVPGVKKEDLKLEYHDDHLVVSGVKRGKKFENSYSLLESASREQIEASLADGILTVEIKKKQNKSPRLIPIK